MLCDEYVQSLPLVASQVASDRGYARKRLLNDIAEALAKDPGNFRLPLDLVLKLILGEAGEKWRLAADHTSTDLTKTQHEVRALRGLARTLLDQLPKDRKEAVENHVRRSLSTEYAG